MCFCTCSRCSDVAAARGSCGKPLRSVECRRRAIHTSRYNRCGAAYCGRIAWLKKPLDAQGKPFLDENNPDPVNRSQPLLGVQLLDTMKPSGKPDHWTGSVYNPEDGETYAATMQIIGEQLKITGCAISFICGSEVWSKVR